jgi:hypothetical protein
MGAQSTYIYRVQRAVSIVYRTIDPPPPSPPSECVLPPQQRLGYTTHSPGSEGVGVNISEDAIHWIGLLQYNPSTDGGVGCLMYHPLLHI